MKTSSGCLPHINHVTDTLTTMRVYWEGFAILILLCGATPHTVFNYTALTACSEVKRKRIDPLGGTHCCGTGTPLSSTPNSSACTTVIFHNFEAVGGLRVE